MVLPLVETECVLTTVASTTKPLFTKFTARSCAPEMMSSVPLLMKVPPAWSDAPSVTRYTPLLRKFPENVAVWPDPVAKVPLLTKSPPK